MTQDAQPTVTLEHAVHRALRSGAVLFALLGLAQSSFHPPENVLNGIKIAAKTLPPCLALSALWGWYFHRLYSKASDPFPFSLVSFFIALFTAPVMPTFPNAISRTMGWRSKNGGDPSTGGVLFRVLFTVVYGFVFVVLIRQNESAFSRAWVICVFAILVNASWTARRTQIWQESRLIQRIPFQPRFSLGTLLLGVLSGAAYATLLLKLPT